MVGDRHEVQRTIDLIKADRRVGVVIPARIAPRGTARKIQSLLRPVDAVEKVRIEGIAGVHMQVPEQRALRTGGMRPAVAGHHFTPTRQSRLQRRGIPAGGQHHQQARRHP